MTQWLVAFEYAPIGIKEEYFRFEVEAETFQDAVEYAKIWMVLNGFDPDRGVNENGDHIGVGEEEGKVMLLGHSL